jgi:hypothetical protein
MNKHTSRDLLNAIGMGQHNATQAIPYLMIAPATTDPKTPMVINMVRLVQQQLYQMGATDVANTGYLDEPTATALLRVTGPNWERMSWAQNIQAILGAQQRGMSLEMPSAAVATVAVGDDSPIQWTRTNTGWVLMGVAAVGILVLDYYSKKGKKGGGG